MTQDDALPAPARELLNRLSGDAAHFDAYRVEGHEVWRVRQRDTGETIIVKSTRKGALARAMADSGVAPRVLAADDAAGFCIIEDLGATTLLDVLAASDAAAASRGLLGLARAAGALHGWSLTAEPPLQPPPVPELPLAAFVNICGALGVDAGRVRGEVMEAERCVCSEYPQVVVHGDSCPDNYVPGAFTEDMGKLVDFDVAQRGNAILEAACWHMPFPTGWRVARVPPELLPQMDAGYRAELSVGLPQPLDTATFHKLLAAGCVYWLVSCLTGKRFVEAEDERLAGPAFASVRERGLLWLDNAAATIAETGHFEGTGDVARELAARLRQRWEPVNDAPLYPAFRSQTGD